MIQKDDKLYLVFTKHSLIKHADASRDYDSDQKKYYQFVKTDYADLLRVENALLGLLIIPLPNDKIIHMPDNSYELSDGTVDALAFMWSVSPQRLVKLKDNFLSYSNLVGVDSSGVVDEIQEIFIAERQNETMLQWKPPFNGIIPVPAISPQRMKGFKFEDPSQKFGRGYSGSPLGALTIDGQLYVIGMLKGAEMAVNSIVIRDVIDSKRLYYCEELGLPCE